MAQQKLLLGHVKGDRGEKGIDAKIASATGTVTPGHLDDPTVTIVMGGEPGAQTMDVTFDGIQGPKGETGQVGPKGETGGYYRPTVTEEGQLSFTAENGAAALQQTWDIKGPVGPAGPAGPVGPAGPTYEPGGTSSQLLMGDGTLKDITTFLTENAEALRTAIGLASTEHDGLMRQLPENPNVGS